METKLDNHPRVLVCQRGARHRYAIPRMFEEAGLLTALYTDSVSQRGIGRIARMVSGLGPLGAPARALAGRRVDGVASRKVFSSDRILYAAILKGAVAADLSSTFRRWGLKGANIVYSMYGEDLGFLEWAKAQGARIVVDVFVHPATNRIIAAESERCHSSGDSRAAAIAKEDKHSVRVFKLADLLLCPSDWVADGVRDFVPECAGKIRIIPYGSSLTVNESIHASPQSGRILFAGRDPMRKGLHYLAEAAHLVRASGMDLDVRVAGVDQDAIPWIEHGRELHCLGRLPMDRMRQEYEQADLFVLPSLSEGQAGVVLEAMACGCPVVATRESGIDFDPESGITVPVRDANALAKALLDVVGNREYRNRLAQGALHQAAKYSIDAWKQRLVQSMREAIEEDGKGVP